jgi:hypothetical protein
LTFWWRCGFLTDFNGISGFRLDLVDTDLGRLGLSFAGLDFHLAVFRLDIVFFDRRDLF